ncbi:MAG TPA: hypothetical protein VFG47_19435 [Geminicoccaceae bacterium]|nr:hypothetical protein [Geminicoccaceae bacterium]
MDQLSYPSGSVYGDYARAAFGLAATAGPLLLLDPAPVLAVILAALAALFAWFGARTALRHGYRFELSDQGIARHGGPIERRLAWADLRRVKLAYYAPQRNRKDGWMQLTLRGPGGPISVDSTLDGFDRVAGKAAAAAAARDLPLDDATAANLTALGFDVPQRAVPAPPAGWQERGRAVN